MDNCYYEKINNEITLINEAVVPKGFDNVVWIKGKSFLLSMVTAKIKDSEFRYIDIDAINNKTCSVNEPKIIETSKAPSRAKRKLFEGCTLFSMVRPYLRNIAYIDKNLEDCVASTGFYVFNPLNFVDGEYLYYLVSSDFVVNSLNFYMKGDNSPSINSDNIEEFYFPIPSLIYQKKVVKYLKQLIPIMEFIEQEKNVLTDTISKLKIRILDYYFGENSCYKSYYENVCLESVCKITMGQSVEENSMTNTNLKSAIEFHQGKIAFGDMFLNHSNQYTLSPKKIIDRNSIVICVRAPVGNVNISNRKIAIGRGLCGISSDKVELMYLYYYLLYMGPYYRSLSQGSTFASITIKTINKTPFMLCSSDLQQTIVASIQSSFDFIDKIKEQLI